MSFRSAIYWLASSIAAAIAVGAAEPDSMTHAAISFTLETGAAGDIIAVPEPSRAILLFAGIMAMAFTYRRAWLNWKRGE